MQGQQAKEKKVVVLGAGTSYLSSRRTQWVTGGTELVGVAGLTTAVALQETGHYLVSILAETFPGDPKRADYTSPWAVCPFGDCRCARIHVRFVPGRAPGFARWRRREGTA